MKKAIITGVAGQDGSYLAELLLEKGYFVWGILRRSSLEYVSRIDHLFKGESKNENFKTIFSDVTDALSINNIISRIEPDEIYNLAAQSHVRHSFDMPGYTAQTDAIGALNILESIRSNGFNSTTKFYQASTSELYGKVKEIPQSETTTFYPRSPYAAAKLYAYWLTVNYREAYGIFATNGILFNHESPRRGNSFITKKVIESVVKIKKGKQNILQIGNLDSRRDWGYAPEYVEAMWRMLQTDTPEDFVIATGEHHSVRELIECVFMHVDIEIIWKGSGKNEVGIDKKNNRILVEIDEYYFRPTEVDLLVGDASKAEKILGWKAKTKFNELVKIMVDYELQISN
ncbi:MAG: GDP-mannose 4,6-dehydratase [Flavobacteriaceae bacterium TMED238]|nr:MAG: GDP-mannose 4,6-dehydratase [Flavobacteriaceae bacterium TMED238]